MEHKKKKKKKRLRCTLVQALRFCTGRTAHRGSRCINLLFLDHGTRRGEGSASRLGRSLPPEKNRYPLYRRLGGPQSRSGLVRKISSQPVFDARTFQPLYSHCTEWATRPTARTVITLIFIFMEIYRVLNGISRAYLDGDAQRVCLWLHKDFTQE